MVQPHRFRTCLNFSNGSYIFWRERRLQMERCYELSTNTYLCYLEGEMDAWIRGWMIFDCPVNGAALQRAADDLQQTMPFLSARKTVAPEGDRYILVSNDTPLHVRDRAQEREAEDRFGLRLALSLASESVYIRSMNINNLRIRILRQKT